MNNISIIKTRYLTEPMEYLLNVIDFYLLLKNGSKLWQNVRTNPVLHVQPKLLENFLMVLKNWSCHKCT